MPELRESQDNARAWRDATPLRAIGVAMTALDEAVDAARAEGVSEAAIRAVLGTRLDPE